MAEPVEVAVHAGVATLALADPRRRNALGREVATALTAAVTALAGRDDVRVLVVTGRGAAFCAGADPADLLAAAAGDSSGVQRVYDAFGAVADFPRPTIAAVNGPAVGAGLNLALACDVRVAARSARFDCRFLALGIHPGGGHAWMLERLVGPQTAAAMLLLGEVLDGAEAARRGLVWSVVDDEALPAVTARLAERAARVPAGLLDAVTATLRGTPALGSRTAALAVETERQLASLRHPDAAARIAGWRAAASGG